MSAACLVPATLDAVQMYVKGRTSSSGAVEWRIVVWQGGEWVILGALIPITYVLGRRFPLRGGHLGRHMGVHLVGALILCLGWAGIGIAMGALLGSTPDRLLGWIMTSLPWSVFMYFTALGCVHAFTYFAEARERDALAARLAAQVAEARLAALRMQFNPHFLLNSLNAALVLVRDRDTANAERTLELLGDVLRQVLQSDAQQEVRLADELRFLDDYLALEQIRFSDRLHVDRDVPPPLIDALVPQFILQPLVENALRHGIGASLTGGTIVIAAHADGDDLVLAVSDNGAGLSAGGAPNGRGVGLRNVRERLATLYGDRASLALTTRADSPGAEAVVRLPLRFHEPSSSAR